MDARETPMMSVFAEKFGLTQTQVFDLMCVRDAIGRVNEKIMSGHTVHHDKIFDKLVEKMTRLAASHGFAVSFDHGIYPVLIRDGIEVYLPE